jgi:thymidylate synthase ThyX
MRSVEPEVFLVARPKVDYEAMAAYLREVGGERWLERIDRGQLEAQDLAEFAGKMCYRSWEPGLNPNVRTLRHTIVARTDQGAEEEIRLVFGKIGELMRAEAPALFGDYTVTEDGTWIPGWRKV